MVPLVGRLPRPANFIEMRILGEKCAGRTTYELKSPTGMIIIIYRRKRSPEIAP